jgi:preprotein translocase subunit SecA
VIGTERHEARRIDNQLRGRTGRQGDPGGTQFFVSLEDTLMRVFASDTVKRLMGKIGLAEDEPIRNGFINRALESAQSKIEGHNFDARKFVLQFDDVLNFQRKTIYERRRNILTGGPKEIYEYVDSLIDSADEETRKAIADKKAKFGEDQFAISVQRAVLQTIDMFWVEHLEAMDYMRGSVQLRAYGQRDPLTEYKKEGLRLFKHMETSIEDEILKLVLNIGGDVYMPAPEKLTETHEQKALVSAADVEKDNENGPSTSQSQVNTGPVVGRNELCPCGSGKKYKHCGLANTREHQSRMKMSI